MLDPEPDSNLNPVPDPDLNPEPESDSVWSVVHQMKENDNEQYFE